MGMLKSPMVLMMLFSGVMMYAMPKLQVRPLFATLGEMLKLQDALADMDPESAQDVAEARKKVEAMKSMDWSGG